VSAVSPPLNNLSGSVGVAAPASHRTAAAASLQTEQSCCSIADEEADKGLLLILQINNSIFNTGPVLVSLAAFGTYAALGHPLTAAVAFPSLALFNLLRFPIVMIPQQVRVSASWLDDRPSGSAGSHTAVMIELQVFVDYVVGGQPHVGHRAAAGRPPLS
jgi:hypothetical protein